MNQADEGLHAVTKADVSRIGDTPQVWGDETGTSQTILFLFPLTKPISYLFQASVCPICKQTLPKCSGMLPSPHPPSKDP